MADKSTSNFLDSPICKNQTTQCNQINDGQEFHKETETTNSLHNVMNLRLSWKISTYFCSAANFFGISLRDETSGSSSSKDFQDTSSSSSFWAESCTSCNLDNSASTFSLRPFSSISFSFNNSLLVWNAINFLASCTSASWQKRIKSYCFTIKLKLYLQRQRLRKYKY